MSNEQMDWLERKGIDFPGKFRYISQDTESVTIESKATGPVTIKKDVRNWHF